eukprot:363662-Chlamydomonas_euryale.AAC.1
MRRDLSHNCHTLHTLTPFTLSPSFVPPACPAEQTALVMDTMETPMGVAGFLLPAVICAATLASIHMGVGAAGAKATSQDNLGEGSHAG